MFTRAIGRSHEKVCCSLGDPEFLSHYIRVSIADPTAIQNICILPPVWHMTCHAQECMLRCLPFCLLLLMTKHHVEEFRPKIFDKNMNKKIRQSLATSLSKCKTMSAFSSFENDITEYDKEDPKRNIDLCEDEENEEEAAEYKVKSVDFATFDVNEIVQCLILDEMYAKASQKIKKKEFNGLYEIFEVFQQISTQQLRFMMQTINEVAKRVKNHAPQLFQANATTRLILKLLDIIAGIENSYYNFVCEGERSLTCMIYI